MRDVSRKMAVGAIWMVMLRMVNRSIGLVSTVVLARLLAPADFGLVAMATSFIALLELMGEFSFDVALIRDAHATRKHYDTVWTISVLFALFTALMLVLLAGLVARFYSEPRLQPVLYCLALSSFVNGFSNVGVVAFRKEMEFRKEFLYMTGRKIVVVSTTIPLAFLLQSYWALVFGMVVSAFAGVGLSYWAHPFRPRFSLHHFHSLFHFSKWLFLNNFFLFLSSRSTDFVIGRISGAQALGIYSIAWEIATLPTTELIAPINRAVFPGYAKLAGDIGSLRAEYLKVFATIVLFALPAGCGLAAVADLIVQVVLGAKWEAAAPLIQILAFCGVLTAIVTNNGMIFVALGNSRLAAIQLGAEVALLVPTMIFATMRYGPHGAAWSFLGLALLLVPINFVFVSKMLHLTVGDYWKTLWRPVFATVTMLLATYPLTLHFLPYAQGLAGLGILLGVIASGAVVYMLAIAFLWLLSGQPGGPERFLLQQLSVRLGLGRWPR